MSDHGSKGLWLFLLAGFGLLFVVGLVQFFLNLGVRETGSFLGVALAVVAAVGVVYAGYRLRRRSNTRP